MRFHLNSTAMSVVVLGSALALGAVQARPAQAGCKDLPSHADLQATLESVVAADDSAGLGNEMWATIVDRDGIVCAVAFSGEDRGDQWPGSRVISAQKANTANAFSLPGDAGFGGALSSGNLYGTVLEQGSLFGLQFSNPVDTGVAYGGPNHAGGNASNYGKPNDPLVGEFIGGVNVFGGGLALYDSDATVLGGLGVSGDTSCTDHIVAWKVRDALGLDNVPGGVGPDNTDNLNLVAVGDVAPNSFEHPECGFGEGTIIPTLHTALPPGS
jgi:uncharacterized protein GlcG (DUF336 family)